MLILNKLHLYAAFASGCLIALSISCSNKITTKTNGTQGPDNVVKPLYITEPVRFDTDDPAIWINRADPARSLVIGTDKDKNGGLYIYDLKGKIVKEKTVKGLKRPNNVDVAYGLTLGGKKFDIAVATERMTHKIRVYSLPDMKPLDNGGIEVYEGQMGIMFRDLMGIALYTDPAGKIYAIVGRKTGPTDGTYLWQYLLEDDGNARLKATLIRKFGKYSGIKEIESIAVDNELGYIYYSDEQVGVRKYYADPAKGNEELALFATEGYTEDNEGISIYKTSATTGYILVSDQSANKFKVYSREGLNNPHNHALIDSVKTATVKSDGSDIVSVPLNSDFKHGLFVAMSDDKTFHFYRWEDIAGSKLIINP
ncbi:phytase [Desertivirga xinjiangensis]|uniref:phytase n=1 Tax=Desertivirga xinjiangensis TaxID=539206 RepID=UPI00210F2043|nr:phytase [Pedobacter xinjiangensis]